MKLIGLILLSAIMFGCNNDSKNLYDEYEYSLVNTDSSEGIVGTRYFIYNHDTARKMRINYWDNGKVLAKGFTYNGKLDGKLEIFDIGGNLMEVDSFNNGRKFYSKKYYTQDTSVKLFKNGKFEPFVSIDSIK